MNQREGGESHPTKEMNDPRLNLDMLAKKR
jgi:hypothetical protein